MNSTDVEDITSSNERTIDKSQSKDNCENVEVGEIAALPKPVSPSPCSSSNDVDNTEDARAIETNKNENIAMQPSLETFTGLNTETIPKGDVVDDFSFDQQEEELKLRWDDDENSLGIGDKEVTTDVSKVSSEDLDEATAKSNDLEESDIAVSNDKICITKTDVATVSSSTTSQSDSFAETEIVAKTNHGINKPDVMLDIPGMLPGMDEELESVLVEFSDTEKDSNLEDTDKGLTKLVLKINDEVMSPLEDGELDSKLEMSSDVDDDTLGNIFSDDKIKLKEAISNELNLLSETMSSIEEQDNIAVKPPGLVDKNTQPDGVSEESNLVLAANGLKLLSETMSKLEQVTEVINEEKLLEPQATPTEQREIDMKLKVSTLISSIEEEMELLDSNDEMESSATNSDNCNIKKSEKSETLSKLEQVNEVINAEKLPEPQGTPTEQRKIDMKLKVSTLISSIEKEIELLDSNDEMEMSATNSDNCNLKKLEKSETMSKLEQVNEVINEEKLPKPQGTPTEQREIDMKLKVSTLISSIEEEMELLDSNDEMEMSPTNSDNCNLKKSEKSKTEPKNKESEIVPKNKSLAESELRQKEQDEIALAVKAIEQENKIDDLTPAVTLVDINPADELSEISVIDEDDQPSTSLVLDDDNESIEVLHQSAGLISVGLDESEVSVIQDSEDDELPILVRDADDMAVECNGRNASQSIEIPESTSKKSEGTPDISNDMIDTKYMESTLIKINEEEKCLKSKHTVLKADETKKIEPRISMLEEINDIKEEMLLEKPSTTMEEKKNSDLPAPADNKLDDDITSEVGKDILKDSSMLNKDETTKENSENINIKLSQISEDDTNKVKDDSSEQGKDMTATEQNEKLSLKVSDDFEPQPSTSAVDFDMNKDSSNDVPDSDTLGLLAESTRVMDDDDDQDDDDDDDDDFYQDDESNLMTAEHSEDSNHQSDDAQETQDVMEAEDKQLTKDTEIQSTDVIMACDQDDNAQESHTEQQEDCFQFSISVVTNDVVKDNDDAKAMETDIQLEAKTVDPSESDIEAKIDAKTKEPGKSVVTPVEMTDASKIAEEMGEPDKPASIPAEKEKKSPNKMLSLSISSQQSVWNFVDLEESSEDEIQIVPKPSETPATAQQPEPQQDVAQSEAVKQSEAPEKETPPKQPDVPPAPALEEAVASDAEMNVEMLDEEILKVDDIEDNKEEATENTTIEKHEEKSKPSPQKQPEQVSDLEVFNLDSDDEDPAAPTAPADAASQPVARPDFKCINSNCRYAPGVACFVADAATVTYYDGDKRRRALVCEDCWKPVQARNQDLVEGIRNLTPLLELDMATLSLDLVEISDSDSDGEPEPEDQEEKIGDVTAKFLEDNLTDMINDTWEKYQMDSRLSDTESVLRMELRRLETESKEIQSFLKESQATTDRIRNELYASFPQEIKEVPPLIIYDTPEQQYCYVQAPLPPKEGEVPPSVPTRISKRRLEAAGADSPAKRPAIPMGYAPLDALEQMENKLPVKGPGADEKNDDDNPDVAVVNIISSEAAPPGLPPAGELVKPPLKVGMTVYAMRNSFGSWVKGKILEIVPKGTQTPSFTTCKVKFEHKNSKTPVKMILARAMAYSEPANVRLTIGTRVIANFKDTKDNKDPSQELKRESFFSGIVAEVPNPVNKYRYLIFFDDGYAQYASHADTRLVCECASLVWEEVHPFSREFVREYLLAYPERPMVRLHPSQSLKTEWNGKWWTSRVVAVDASLARVHTAANDRHEWIYRGSTRLAPLYLELQAAERHRARPMPRAQALARANMPVVEYTRYDEQTNKTFEVEKTPLQQRQEAEALRQRAVAKKSTGGAPAPPPARHATGKDTDNVTSRVVYYTPKNALKPHKMVPHTCGPKCKRSDVIALKDLRTYNPLAKPLLSGWERQIVRYKGQKAVTYRAPCGRRVRSARELHRYLRATRAELPVDLFDFSPATHCLAEFVLNKCLITKKDLSHGKENVPVPCVNYYDETLPEFCVYNTERTPTAGVPLNLDPEFLCGCDCEDDCEDKSKCACWKLTLEGARTIGLEGDNVGYVYKRLPEPLPSGIYECNSRCKCKHTCLNRVAQHPLQLKLQIFKTLNRGWGIRALNDVPKGSFLCVYAGNLLTDATANLDGLNEGDEYLAELDYIEVVEQMKEGYEEDIPKELKKMTLDKKDGEGEESDQEESSEDEKRKTSKTELEDDDFQPAPHYGGVRVTQFSKRLRERNRNKEEKNATEDKKEGEKEKEKDESKKEGERGSNDEDCITISDDDEVREPSSFAAAAGMGANAFVSKYRSVRSLFGEDESCYIMDAKVQGNIGRYLNHSCSPNVFVQNVFVDTHDPRFPWVAFFALSHVRAGSELTWNYNYDVGSVPGKALYCYCGAPNCRGRLL